MIAAIVVLNSRVVEIWKRVAQTNSARVDVEPWEPIENAISRLQSAAEEYRDSSKPSSKSY